MGVSIRVSNVPPGGGHQVGRGTRKTGVARFETGHLGQRETLCQSLKVRRGRTFWALVLLSGLVSTSC